MSKKPKPRIVCHRPRIVDHTPEIVRWPPCSQQITTEGVLSYRRLNERAALKADRLGVGLYQCFQMATYEIEGQWYCKRHAALIALEILAEDP